MKFTLPLLAALIALPSFAAELPADLEAIVNKLDSECAGNDNGFIAQFDVKKFSKAKVMKALKADQKGENECRSIISHSKANGVASTLYTLFSKNSGESECVNTTLDDSEQAKLRAMIEDPTNLGVFSKEWDGDSGDSEYCMYANYDIYRADGTLVSLVFNHTD